MINNNIENLLTIKSISLVGFMGVGKSTIGKKLSSELNLIFYDSDKEIEKEKGMTIESIFNLHGEKYFREIEERYIVKLLERNEKFIISLGGGSYINNNIRKMLKQNTVTIWLSADINVIYRRLQKSKNIRPIAKKVKSKIELANILHKRNLVYQEADIKLDVSLIRRKQAIELILNSLNKYALNNHEKSIS